MVQSLPLIPVSSWGLPPCASPGHPTPVSTCYFHFCTDTDAEFSSPFEMPQGTPLPTHWPQRLI